MEKISHRSLLKGLLDTQRLTLGVSFNTSEVSLLFIKVLFPVRLIYNSSILFQVKVSTFGLLQIDILVFNIW